MQKKVEKNRENNLKIYTFAPQMRDVKYQSHRIYFILWHI